MSMTVGDEREHDEEHYNSKEVSITHTSRESSDVMWHDAAHNSQLIQKSLQDTAELKAMKKITE